MKRVLRSLALVAIAVVSFNAAQAQNPKFQKGSFSYTTNGGKVYTSGVIVGLGNVSKSAASVTVSSHWDITYHCVNPGGQTPTPFAHVDAEASATVTVIPDKNGRYSFTNVENDVEIVASNLKPQWRDKFCPSHTWELVFDKFDLMAEPTVTINGMTVAH